MGRSAAGLFTAEGAAVAWMDCNAAGLDCTVGDAPKIVADQTDKTAVVAGIAEFSLDYWPLPTHAKNLHVKQACRTLQWEHSPAFNKYVMDRGRTHLGCRLRCLR